ncbi:hypothetical protein NHQ30_002042 [Ciborinia camelliae]|nr:hypothetical protein NHQ30_002042 [Ciborinia camelliae]
MDFPMVAQNPLINWNPKYGRFHSIWATEAGTRWARQYGVLPEYLDPTQLFYPYRKSALTPYATDTPRLQEERRNLQKWLMSGFWPELLHEMGAYPYELAYTPALTNPIDPLFDLELWESYRTGDIRPVLPIEFPQHESFFPLEPDNTMFWTAHNPAVWRRLDPILRLCTRFLNHSSAASWLDAFYFGLRTDVPDRLDRRTAWEKLEHGPLKYFHKRDPALRDDALTEEKTKHLKRILKERVQFGIGSGFFTPWDRKTPSGTGWAWNGCTFITTETQNRNLELYREDKAWIDLALELLLPLFRHDLSPIERLISQFYIATVVLHEFAHALNQLQDPPMGRTGTRNEPAFGGDEAGKGREAFCELGFSFVKGLLGANTRIVNPGVIVGAPVVSLLLTQEIPPRTYDKGIFLHEPGQDPTKIEKNTVAPIVSKYYEQIHTDEFWDRMATNFGISIISPTPAPVLVVQPDPARPELSNYVFNDTKRKWMTTLDLMISNNDLLSRLDPGQRKDVEKALKQRDEEFNKLRRVRYLDMRKDTASLVTECYQALEKYFTQAPGDLSGSQILGLLERFATTLQREADQEAECAIQFVADSDFSMASDIEFGNDLMETNRQAEEMVLKAKSDCNRLGIATLGENYQKLHSIFDQIIFAMRAIRYILANRVKPYLQESYVDVITRVLNTVDPQGIERLRWSNAEVRGIPTAGHFTISTHNEALTAYFSHDYDTCHAIGKGLLSQLDMEGYNQGIGLVLMAMHPGELRRRWCSRQGLHALTVMAKSDGTVFMEQWMEIARRVHQSIEDLTVNTSIGDGLCVLEID